MTLRPQPCRWFEVIVARDDAFLALQALAAAGCVEVEWHRSTRADGSVPPELLKTLATLARRYQPYWPAARPAPVRECRLPTDALAAGVATLQAWALDADPLIAQLQSAEAEAAELDMAATALREMAGTRIDFAALAHADAGVEAALFALPAGADVDPPQEAITRQIALGAEELVLVIAPPAAIAAMGRAVAEANGRRARLPQFLQPKAEDNLQQIGRLRAERQTQIGRLREALADVAARHGVAGALGEAARARWCNEHGGAIADGDIMARITGWTTDREQLVQALEASDARALVNFPQPPRGARSPLVLRNPWWARPFELFTRLVGMPGASGADPSMLLALAVPLMFGYMFGDVGQGLVLAVFGWLMRHRLPLLRLLVPCGLAAAVFGFVFGSVFTLEHVIAPWWLHPMEHPLPVLLVPIYGGALLLLLGLALGALEAWWERRLDQWLREDAPVIPAYAGALAVFFTPLGWWLLAAAVLWAMAAAALHRRRIGSAFAALGELLEHAVQVLINTLSFARVGAFALAHAGLSSAVVALATASANRAVFIIVLVLGNALILVVEGLVVSIQTTRLVLFEFFTRFFRPEGREFRPLAAPPLTLN